MRCIHALRKPMIAENTAANVVCEGVGGLNIDGTRIPVQEGEFLYQTQGSKRAAGRRPMRGVAMGAFPPPSEEATPTPAQPPATFSMQTRT